MALVGIKRFTNIPVSALGSSTRRILAKQLNPPKQTVSSDGISQDKEGLADLMGYQYSDIQNYAMKPDFTISLLEDWSTTQGSTIALLWDYLEQMERHDLLEDGVLIKRIEKDAERHRNREETEKSLMMGQPVQVPEVESSEPPKFPANDHHCDQFRNITIGEAKTGKPEFFDAFVCYTSDNFGFVRQMMQMLEGIHGLKLCISNRDLMPGTSQYTTVAKLIEERCKKMIIVLSPAYLQSAECDFQTKFAHSLSPGSRSKKLIPVLIEHPCVPPNILRHITPVDYTKCDLVAWFWERLAKSLEENSYGVDDDMYGMALGPPAQAMVEGSLPIEPGENIDRLPTPTLSNCQTSFSTGSMNDSSSQLSMPSMPSSGSLASVAYPPMDTDEPNQFMPAPEKLKKGKKKSKSSSVLSKVFPNPKRF